MLRRVRIRLRAQINRVVVIGGLLCALPTIVVAERCRPGAGRRVARLAVRVLSAVAGVRFDIDVDGDSVGATRTVLVSNHRSPVDVAAMLLARPNARFAAAAELFRIPLLGGAMRALDSIPIDRSNPATAGADLVREATASDGDVIVFAEGGIHPGEELGQFKSGAFRAAIASGRSVVPIGITGSSDVLGSRAALKVRPGLVTVVVGAPICTDGLGTRDVDALRDRTRAAVIRALVSVA